MILNPREARGIALRLLLWLPVLLWLAWHWGDQYAHFFLPLYQQVLEWVLGGLRFADLKIIHTNEYLVQADYRIGQFFFLGQQLIPAGVAGFTHAPIYYTLVHPIVLAAAALIWPRLTWRGRILRLAASLPVLVLLEALDIPLVIYSSINEALVQTYDPHGYLADQPTDWVRLLEGGGRYALCIAGSFAAASLHNALARMFKRRPSATA